MSDLMLDVGTASDLKMAFRRAGYDTADIAKLCADDMAAKILPVLRGLGIVQIVKHVINLLVAPSSEQFDGFFSCEIDEHDVGAGELEWDQSKVDLYVSKDQIQSLYVILSCFVLFVLVL